MAIFAIVKNEAEAQGGAQETMTTAFRDLAEFRGESKFSTWRNEPGPPTAAEVGLLPEKYREVSVLRDMQELNSRNPRRSSA